MAEKALREFLARVERVNWDARFLGRVNRVVLFGSILRENDRLIDLDLAVEILPKIDDRARLEARNLRRIESLARAGHVFRDIFDIYLHWRREVFRFLKSGSRVISLADYIAEKSFIMNVPHPMLLGKEETVPAELPPEPKPRVKPGRLPRDCPF
jgi:predicted nucleotidyltransferase